MYEGLTAGNRNFGRGQISGKGSRAPYGELSPKRFDDVKDFFMYQRNRAMQGILYQTAETVISGSISSRIMFSMAINVPVSELGQLPQAP